MPIAFVPSTAAPTHPGRFRADPVALLQGGLAGATGGAFLPGLFPAGRQILQAAFGADLSAAPGSWVWTDVTTYVRWNPGITIQIGAGGTTTRRITASFLTCKVDNDQSGGGDWTIGNATGRWAGRLRENTPIRGQLDIGGGVMDRFVGYLTSASPTRGPAGENWVTLLANGVSRRITKGKSKPFSALRKSYDRSAPSAYWSLEKGEGGTVGASAVARVPDMTVTAGAVSFGTADDSLPASLPLASFTRDGVGGQLTGVIPATSPPITGSVDWSREFVFKQSALAAAASISVMDWYVRGTIDLWNVTLKPVVDGGFILGFINTSGGVQSYLSNVAVDDGEWHHVRVDCQQTGGIAVQVKLDGTQIISQSTTGTNGVVTTVIINPDASTSSSFPSVGHQAVWNTARNTEDTLDAFRGHTGETVAERMTRLSAEADVMLTIVGDADDLMGPQRAAAYLDLIQDAADVDAGGLLVDGLNTGLTYFTRQGGYSKGAALTLTSADGDFPGSVQGVHTDQDRVNRYTASDPLTNADRTFEQTEGALGSDPATGVGTYEDGGQHRVNIVDQLDQIAAWQVGQGTVPGLRWPALTIELAKPLTAAKAGQWLGARPLDRIDALGITTGSLPDRRLLLRGWTERWNSLRWWVTVLVIPYDGYAVTTLAADTGDTGEFVGWLDTDDAVRTVAAVSAGATSITVDVGASGTVLTYPAVSTYADDLLGLYINLDGLKVAVTAITAPSGMQQTLTITGAHVLRDVPTGACVSAWNPVRAGL